MKKAIQFGAGNIGRGFIGYLLNKAGYNLIFADVFDNVLDEINSEKQYNIYVKDVNSETIEVKGVSGVNSKSDQIIDEIADASIITTAIGPLNLKYVGPTIAKGIVRRIEHSSEDFLNIIACENAVFASSQLKEYVYENLTEDEKSYADKFVGFPNCAVDRIIPPSTNPKPLDVTVESFYEWIVEKSAFKGELPQIEGMTLSDNLLAFIERKLFTLNTGHATIAYIGNLKGYKTIDEAIGDKEIEEITRSTMQESGEALIKKFAFNKDEHFAYIEKILKRFTNPHLRDELVRVGREPIRKLSANERFIKPLNTALEYDLPVNYLINAIGASLHFESEHDKQSIELQEKIKEAGVKDTVKEITQITDEKILDEITKAYESFK